MRPLLEKRVIEGGFYYIHSIKHGPVGKSLTIELMKAPEEKSLARRFLIFTDIKDYSEEIQRDSAIEEAKDGVIDSLIGLEEFIKDGKLMYEVVTEDRVLDFSTNTKPRIEAV